MVLNEALQINVSSLQSSDQGPNLAEFARKNFRFQLMKRKGSVIGNQRSNTSA